MAGSVKLAWNPNPEPDIAGYVLVWGTAPGVYTGSATVAPDVSITQLTGLADGTYYFAVRAFNVAGTAQRVLQRSDRRHQLVGHRTDGMSGASSVEWARVKGVTDVVTFTGTGFQAGAVVRFGATAGTVLQLTATSIMVRTPAGSAGTVAVSVTNPDGGTATLLGVHLPVDATVSGPSPSSGPTTGGTDVVVTGAGFLAGAVVRFGAAAGTVQRVTATSITVRTPAGSPAPSR